MLPHARPGGIAGLLELLADRGGRDDLYKLADELGMEVDDLLPIVEAAVLLGFATLEEGDVEITPEGKTFAEADIQIQKVLFREAALQNIAILRLSDEQRCTPSATTRSAKNSSATFSTSTSQQDEVERQIRDRAELGTLRRNLRLRFRDAAASSMREDA